MLSFLRLVFVNCIIYLLFYCIWLTAKILFKCLAKDNSCQCTNDPNSNLLKQTTHFILCIQLSSKQKYNVLIITEKIVGQLFFAFITLYLIQYYKMLVKKLGTILIINTKAYKILALLSPLLMLCSIILTAYVPHITQTYQFQQPILRTKLINIQPIPNDKYQGFDPMQMQQVYPGIGLTLVAGRISNEVIILASHCEFTQKEINFSIFSNIYNQIMLNNIKGKRLLAKNVGFVCYNQREDLHNYINQYQNAFINVSRPFNRFGIIRNALIIQKWKTNRQTPKIYFNIYSSQTQIHTDVDYYQAIKQLLQQVGLTKWQPCRAIDQSRFISSIVKQTNKYWWSLFLKNQLCQLHEVWRKTKVRKFPSYPFQILKTRTSKNKYNNNYMFLQNGIQAGTIEIEYNQNNQTQILGSLNRLALSFINQFVVLEDHLHSASTLFVPLNQSKFIPIKGLIIPGITFMLFAAIHLIIKAVYLLNQTKVQAKQIISEQQRNQQKQYLKNSLKLESINAHPNIVLMLSCLYLSSIQYYMNETIFISLLLMTIGRNNWGIKLGERHKQMVCIVITGVNIFLCEYFAILCFPLSIISIITSNLIIFCNKIITFLMLIIITAGICIIGNLGIFQLMQELYNMSIYGQITLYPLLIWMLIS